MMARKKPKNLTLKKRIIKILKDSDRVISANEMITLLIGSGLHQMFIPCSSNSLAQILRATKGISKSDEVWTSEMGNHYVSAGYYLESEEAFNAWVESKMVN